MLFISRLYCSTKVCRLVGSAQIQSLKASRMSSPDIRAGIALLIAALCADGVSIIDNIDQIDRGYQHIDQRLNFQN